MEFSLQLVSHSAALSLQSPAKKFEYKPPGVLPFAFFPSPAQYAASSMSGHEANEKERERASECVVKLPVPFACVARQTATSRKDYMLIEELQ